MKKMGAFLNLFLSLSTLLCCALPALLVTLGFGAAFSSFLAQFQQLIWISENKNIVFIVAGLSLLMAGFFQWRSQSAACPVDPVQREACLWSRRWGLRIYLVSLFVFFIGFFFAFLITLLPI